MFKFNFQATLATIQTFVRRINAVGEGIEGSEFVREVVLEVMHVCEHPEVPDYIGVRFKFSISRLIV